jgi:hypothetical protein
MFHEPVMVDLAVRLTERHLHSAAPDAPVVAHRVRRRRRLGAGAAVNRSQRTLS